MSQRIASYLPQSMLIRLRPSCRLFDYDDPAYEPTPMVMGFFFHEYVHYLHNISTVNGIVAFINTIDLWRSFRETFTSELVSQGSGTLSSEKQLRLRALTTYLDKERQSGSPRLNNIFVPSHLRISSAKLEPVAPQVQSAEPLLHVIVCDGHVHDRDDNVEQCNVYVGTLEVAECAAWLLEKRMVLALDAYATLNIAPIFPNRAVEALAAFVGPELDEETVLACALAALQSSDVPEALLDALALAARELRNGNDPIQELRRQVLGNLTSARSRLDAQFDKLCREFDGENVFAIPLRSVIGSARDAFNLRTRDPFFEFDLISRVAAERNGFAEVFRHVVPCTVIQERDGGDEELQRDFFFSFKPFQPNQTIDPEEALRVVHSAFHFMSVHRIEHGFAPTNLAVRCRCPFFTSCNLALRQKEPDLCRERPWLSLEWKGWNGASCWYAAGVRVTQLPSPRARPKFAGRVASFLLALRRWIKQRLGFL